MKLLWLSDTHFDHCVGTPEVLGKYLAKEYSPVSGAIISGDVSRRSRFARDIKGMSNGLEAPVWFVLGNHDGWGESWEEVQEMACQVPGYLSKGELVKFPEGIVAAGYDRGQDR